MWRFFNKCGDLLAKVCIVFLKPIFQRFIQETSDGIGSNNLDRPTYTLLLRGFRICTLHGKRSRNTYESHNDCKGYVCIPMNLEFQMAPRS